LATTTTPAPGSALRAIAGLHARLVLSGLSSNLAAVPSATACTRSSRTLPTTTASPARASTACDPACADDHHPDGDDHGALTSAAADVVRQFTSPR